MSSPCFVTQEATKEILLRVTNVCAECYDDIHEGDTIHYDMQNYRYLCKSCQEKLCAQMNENCEVVVDESEGLFG
ncbi:hypothetical protein MN086_07740 [Sulfurovum sp. XGS-02]|uniref:hypothetical protein n=1 Tax=Sulfurovum sp. XGS-02 TaxID=2925411 RepID=UPI00206DAC4C|nr:hypothetical protein [Sulfurovum sp. XGS-02]UPT76945.1 hypothetical protein MN086_07740 [Sulfurovum sp. XGS-02]